MSTLTAQPGQHIRDVIREAVRLASESGEKVEFDFNGQTYAALPGEDYEQAKARIGQEHGLEILEPEEAAAKFKAECEERKRKFQEAIANTGDLDEAAMREQKVPTFETLEDLSRYIDSLAKRPHDYGTCVYAMSMAATAAFNYVSGQLGVTGFQASCADMDVLRRLRGWEHGFRVVDYSGILYPQYWTPETTPIFKAALKEDEARARFADEARKLLKQSRYADDAVRKHWEYIASLAPQSKATGESQ